MATASVTTTFVNGLLSDADEVNANFTDLVTFLNASVVHVDGSKAFTAAVTGVAPTSDLHLSTRKFADTGTFVFTHTGDAVVGSGTTELPLPFNIEIIEVIVRAQTAPTGSGVTVDVHVDAVTVFTTQSNRPTVPAANWDASATTIEDASHTDGQIMTVDIDAIGSTTPGSNITVVVRYRRT